jgi:multimeric flavodoxin WrbA
MKDIAVIFGSARSRGNTFKAVELVKSKIHDMPIFDLEKYDISDYDYNHKNKYDDFLRLIEIIIDYKTIILATPVYWYTMSASMKRFLDRLSDLLSIYKDYGRLLRNKNLAVISSYSVHPDGKNGFEQIFINTAKYLSMNYLGCYFFYSGDNKKIIAINSDLAEQFISQLNKNPAIT